jgi:hypothetical protein
MQRQRCQAHCLLPPTRRHPRASVSATLLAVQGDATEDEGILAPLREQSKADPEAVQGDATEDGGLLAPLREQSKADPEAVQGDATEDGGLLAPLREQRQRCQAHRLLQPTRRHARASVSAAPNRCK